MRGPAPPGGGRERRKVLLLWESLHQWGDELGQRGSFRGSEERAGACCGKPNGGKPAQRIPVVPRLRHKPAGVCRDWVLELGLRRTAPRRGLGLAAARQPEGPGVWYEPNLRAAEPGSPLKKPCC